ncbi:peptide-N4-(N-acetyl-beta-glucosaminyl)asparagine amidase A-like [Cynara cardunculus var. scolymus]|uniref:Peptide N-acetyl-beta-D-glucosaminyl asparaginase amidase A N-terminal domain-containing protein n=1 Tax=Cynara cardunculus var. scolymus TaxID=59895 RepID=A0A118K2S8_CYNCS|nr:peptide-N4-(N-acetyl-beta-glucosaminyl)asparagine amidase A-like [Cynara cardunculus var. scolymus]KVI04845.1 hypothetical protein Ccrd_016838 [Cynara cardunculus var. scolymus]
MNIADLLILLLPLYFAIPIQSSSSPPHFLKSFTQNSGNETINVAPQEYFEVTRPLPTDAITPACSVNVLDYNFGYTYGSPPVTVDYIPPPVTCNWSLAVLEFRAECKGEQYDRIAGVWIDGVELLRTSTAQPTEDGIFWTVRKDVTRYASIIRQDNHTLSVMLENIVNDEFTGVYHVNVSFLFYSGKDVRVPLSVVSGDSETHRLNRKLISVKTHGNEDKIELDRVLNLLYPYDKPADLIIPISGAIDEGFWFRIQNETDVQRKNVQISQKTYKAVLELYVSFHGDDEFWYMNPSDSYIEANHLATGRAHGAYREVLVTIDGILVGAVIPFPVIFTGGINPLFWEPVVSIGAFDLPSYDIDLTPFLGLLSDNKSHSIGLQVADGISFWLVDANLHLWLDHSNVKAETLKYKVPSMEIERQNQFKRLDGEFELEGERESEAKGLVTSSFGKLKIEYTDKMKFKSKLKFQDQGTRKRLNQRVNRNSRITITDENGELIQSLQVKIKYPLNINIKTGPGSDPDTSIMNTTVVQGRSEAFYDVNDSRVLNHSQNCNGSMVIKGNAVLSGTADNHQIYDYKDGFGCYSRNVDVVGGHVVGDVASAVCA